MNINRHNYEEFFLLYVDKELSAAERKTVELFVQENPDLEAELLLLQDTVLSPGNFTFDKSSLLKTDDFATLQEKLVLYGDNELDQHEAAGIKELLLKDKAAAAEWNVLQATRLQPESVVFEDKASLYRKEPGRVVAFKWWRVAAAAVLLGFGTWTGMSVYNKNSTTIKGNEVASGQPEKKNGNQPNTAIAGVQPSADSNTGNTNDADANHNNSTAVINVPVESGKTLTADHSNKNTVTPNPVQRTVVKDNNTLVANDPDNNKQQQQPSNNLPRPYFENINKRESNTIASVNVPPVEDNNKSGTVIASNNPKDKQVVDIADNPTNANPYAKLAGADENMNYLEDDKNKKTKLGGFFRKVRRVLERSANIKTGEGIQIAGFEIAAK